VLSVTSEQRNELISEFWLSVRERLISEHRREPLQADSGIRKYRHALESRGVGDTLYNQGVELTAEAVDALVDGKS
jgi:hypothetical protein